jgi:protein TonB
VIPAHANGAATHAERPLARSPRSREPLDAVLDLGRQASGGLVVGLILAILFHGTAAARAAAMPLEFMRWSQKVGQQIHEHLSAVYDIDVAKPPPEPEPAPPPPEPVKEEPRALLPPPPPAMHAAKEEAPAPAAAQASAVLTKAAEPDEPVDLTGFVTGNAAAYAGGVTEQSGTSASAVYDANARRGGVPGGHGTATAAPPPPPTPDRSKPAGLSGSSEWKCPWPSEADAEQIDDAYVSVQVTTRPDGTAERVTILSDPGHGFAREARQCAMRERYNAALDHEGNPIGGLTKAFRIHFER